MKNICFLLVAILATVQLTAQTLYKNIESSILGETRELKIQVPRGHDAYENDGKKYPLVVVLDGDYLFEPVAGIERHGLHVSLLPVSYALEAWLPEFDRLWPVGSPAAVSYRNRILKGTSLSADDVIFPSLI